jgi:RNA polymerase sigma factor (sigma-70 family)
VPAPDDSPVPKMTVYEQYRAELIKFFAKNACDRNAIEEMVQAVYVRLFRRQSNEPVRDHRAYLFEVARNVLNDANRRAQVDRKHTVICDPSKLEEYGNEHGATLWIEDSLDELIDQAEIARAFNKLARTSQIAWIHQRNGLSYREISEKMNVTEHAVKKYIGAALKGLRDSLGRDRPAKSPRGPKR